MGKYVNFRVGNNGGGHMRRYIKANFAEELVRNKVVVLRDTRPPGEEAQVDYGLLGRWQDPVSGRLRRVWGFLMVLCFSRMLFLRPVLTMDDRTWVECHVLAFEFFGGAVCRVVPDNLKTGVIKADLYDPLINKADPGAANHFVTTPVKPEDPHFELVGGPKQTGPLADSRRRRGAPASWVHW